MSATQQRKEECRAEVRGFLANRSAVSFPVESVQRALKREGFDFSTDEVKDALVFLKGLKEVEIVPAELGATLYFQITAQGTLAHERSGAR